MNTRHLICLVEEPSMGAFLNALLPRLLPEGRIFEVRAFQGKNDLLVKLESRLRGYARFLPADCRIVVVVDRDGDDCNELKDRLETHARAAGLTSRSTCRSTDWQIVNRIAIEELEAWYFGDWQAVRSNFPRVPASIPAKAGFRDPDAIVGGTWEAFERVLQKHGYFKAGLPKIEVARFMGARIEVEQTRSRSFAVLYQALSEALA